MENEETRAPQTQYMENQYVKVYGIIKSLQGQKCVQAFRIIPIKDLNEITNHILECVNASIYYSNKSTGESLDINMGESNPLKNANLNGTHDSHNASSFGSLSSIQNQVKF